MHVPGGLAVRGIEWQAREFPEHSGREPPLILIGVLAAGRECV